MLSPRPRFPEMAQGCHDPAVPYGSAYWGAPAGHTRVVEVIGAAESDPKATSTELLGCKHHRHHCWHTRSSLQPDAGCFHDWPPFLISAFCSAPSASAVCCSGAGNSGPRDRQGGAHGPPGFRGRSTRATLMKGRRIRRFGDPYATPIFGLATGPTRRCCVTARTRPGRERLPSGT